MKLREKLKRTKRRFKYLKENQQSRSPQFTKVKAKFEKENGKLVHSLSKWKMKIKGDKELK